MTFLEAQKALCRKLNISFDTISNNDTFSLEDIKDWINEGGMQAYDYEFWDFAEHSKTAVLLTADVTAGYVAYPNDILSASIYYVTINGKEFYKKSFQSYTKWFQERSGDTGRYWAEFKRLFFFNKNAVSAGQTLDIYGRRGFRALVNDADLLPFSPDTDNEEMSGNQSVIYLAYAEALSSEKKKNPQQGEIERKKGYAVLDILRNQLKQGRALEQSKNRPMFDVPDMFSGSKGGGNSSIGNFTQF